MHVPAALFNILFAHVKKRRCCGNEARQTRGRPQKLDDRYILVDMISRFSLSCTPSVREVALRWPKTVWALGALPHFNSWSRLKETGKSCPRSGVEGAALPNQPTIARVLDSFDRVPESVNAGSASTGRRPCNQGVDCIHQGHNRAVLGRVV